MRSLTAIVDEFVEQWVKKAEHDLGAAESLFKIKTDYYDVISFHCQQAVEKYLKALLVKHQIEFTKTHDIEILIELASTVEPDLSEEIAATRSLSRYAVDSRYPEDIKNSVSKKDAEAALKIATQACAAIRLRLELEGSENDAPHG